MLKVHVTILACSIFDGDLRESRRSKHTKPFLTHSLERKVTITVNCIFHPVRAFHTKKHHEASCGKNEEDECEKERKNSIRND